MGLLEMKPDQLGGPTCLSVAVLGREGIQDAIHQARHLSLIPRGTSKRWLVHKPPGQRGLGGVLKTMSPIVDTLLGNVLPSGDGRDGIPLVEPQEGLNPTKKRDVSAVLELRLEFGALLGSQTEANHPCLLSTFQSNYPISQNHSD
jgi:hypothetical protein